MANQYIGARVQGSEVRLFGSKKEAQDAARAIRWPVKSAARVHTRFCICWALSFGSDGGYLSRDRFGEMFREWNPGKEFS